jgi:hypothetical protein
VSPEGNIRIGVFRRHIIKKKGNKAWNSRGKKASCTFPWKGMVISAAAFVTGSNTPEWKWSISHDL